MPLLYKKPFRRTELPEDLDDNEEVFYCELTNEIFRDYEEFCERIILCNSLVWACSLSGRAYLTYQEALASEESAKAMLNDFPMELRIPVLYLTTLTQRKSLNELAEDVYCFAKDRYFIGESVEVEIPGGSLTTCQILRVIQPSEEDKDSFKKQNVKNGERQYWPPGSLYRYEVQPVANEKSKPLIVSAELIHRKKSYYSRAKNRLYIKQFTEQVCGFWKLKDKTAEKYGISRVKFDLIFVGEAPDLSPTKKASPNNQVKAGGAGKKEKRQESIDKYFTKKSPSKQQNSQPMDAHQKSLLQKLKEKYKVQNAKNSTLANKIANKQEAFRQKRKYTKKKLLQSSDKNSVLTEMEIKQRKQEEKLKLREQKRKKKEQVALLMKEYNRKKEDLELEDLQDLPEPLPIELRVPNELFGEFVMIMEFLHTFQETINLKDYFPAGMTLDLLERALVENEVAGPLCDIIQMLLTAIFELQEEEDDEIREDSDLRSSDWQDVADVAGDMRTKEAVRQATIAARWSQAYHRTPLNKLTLDASTVTEVLRLHLLASGGRCGDSSSKWRYQQRGGYSSLDDPGLMLRLSQPQILDSLSQIPFCDLSIGDKLAILSCLINQILTFSAVRDVIDERMDKIKQGKVELRSLHANDKRREQEAYQKLKDGEWTAEQLEKEKEILHRRKQDQNRRLRELNEENQSNQVLPLGQDRAYRRFWLFTAIPGLFVEHDDRHAGTCLPKGTPALDLGLLNGEDPEMYVKRLFEQGSNKENLLKTPIKTPITPTKTPSKASLPKTPIKGASPSKVAEEKVRRPLTCWADALCPVHSDQGERVCWAFYQDEAAVDELIAKLNKRGMREHALQATLEDERERVVQSITKCPISRLNTNLCPTLETRKSSRNNPRYDNANLNFPPGTPSEEILESVLRDLILETEEKINDGCLGSLKVHDRKAWREAIANSSYDQQCEKLVWGGSSRNNSQGEMSSDIGGDEEGQSRPGTPSSEASFRDLQLDASIEQKTKVRDLASAILQLEQSIDFKYLKRPLGKEEKKENNEKGQKAAQVARERWEASLMTSTSLSQLFLHISTLDSSITWGRSILKASCRLCRRRGDPEKMLLCDGCNKGHHMYCLKPKLTSVPQGNWYCPKCKPREKSSPVKKSRRIFTEDSDEDEEKENDTGKNLPVGQCKVCRSKGPVIICETCDAGYHFDCIVPVLRKIPTGNWYCQKCRRGSTAAATTKKDETSPSSDGERASRRRSSKAATAKISQFAKQLRTNTWEGDNEGVPDGSRRRSRRSLEAELVVTTNAAAKDLPLDNATLQEILDQMMHHEAAWPFLRPVTRADVEDYHDIIKHPMDFGTIKHKLNMLDYRNNSEVLADALLVFENCYAYNKEDTEIYQCGVQLHELLEKLCRERGLKLKTSDYRAPAAKKSRTAL